MIILREAWFGIRRQPWLTILLILQIAISVTLIILLGTGLMAAQGRLQTLTSHFDTGGIYTLSDQATDYELRAYINQPEKLQQLKDFCQAMTGHKHFSYIVTSWQPCSLIDFSGPDRFRVGYENGIAIATYNSEQRQLTDVKACQLNLMAIEKYNLELFQGSNLTADDFIAKHGPVPVLLGYDYASIYQIGDLIPALYLQSEVQLAVAGILAQDSAIVEHDELRYLDRLIVMPSLSWSTAPQNSAETFVQGATLFNQINGQIMLSPGATLAELVTAMEQARLVHGITFDFSILAQDMATLNLLKLAARASWQNLIMIIALLMTMNGLTTYFAIWIKNRRNRRTYGILLLHDYHLNEMRLIRLIEAWLLTGCALAFVFGLTNLLLRTSFNWFVFILAAGMTLLLPMSGLLIPSNDYINAQRGE